MCGKPPQTILDYENLSRLVGGFVVGQSLPQKWPKFVFGAPEGVRPRVVESKSLKVGKSLKIGKNWIKSEKLEFIFY